MIRRFGVLAVLVLGLAGCIHPPFTRLQSDEETEREKDLAVRNIGEVTEVANVQPLQVSGVGLVTGLEGTGHSPQGQYRTMLERELLKLKVANVKALLDSPDNALVLVTAFIPAGARKGDRLDLEVTLPPLSKTELRGGYLQDCFLRNHDTTKNVNPDFTGSNRMMEGHILARAKGPLLVGLGNPDEPRELRRARVWGGGLSLIDRPFYLVLKNDEKSARIANAVADHINLMFQDDVRKQQIIRENQRYILENEIVKQLNHKTDQTLGKGEMAKAVNDRLINVRVPYAYRFNPERYLRVARLMPLREVPEQQGRYRRRLHKMLADPAETIRAALRLEALGKDSIPALKRGLDSEHPLVRFAAAEALAYLGSTAGVAELTRLAEPPKDKGGVEKLDQYHCHPVRLHCLKALASLDEAVCRTKLADMLASSDTELRCGAFRALRILMDETDLQKHLDGERRDQPQRHPLGGDLLGQAFWLHRVAPKSAPLVHFALSKRAEVVLFGDNIELLTPVKILAGSEFTITAEPNDDRCTVSRITSQGAVAGKQCTLRLEDVLRTMADLGAQYTEVVDLLRKLDERQALSCRAVADNLPPETSIEILVEGGRQDPQFLKGPPTVK